MTIPASYPVDGKDMSPVLIGTANASQHPVFLHYCGFNIPAARVYGRWKVFWYLLTRGPVDRYRISISDHLGTRAFWLAQRHWIVHADCGVVLYVWLAHVVVFVVVFCLFVCRAVQRWYTHDARNSSVCLECCNGINPVRPR